MKSTIIPHPLDVAARAHGPRMALSFGECQWTFAELQASAQAAARHMAPVLPPAPVPSLPAPWAGYPRSGWRSGGEGFHGRGGAGSPHGARIGILSATRPGYVFALHAAAYLGASVVPLNWRLTPVELAQQIRGANVGLVLVDEPRMDAAIRATADRPISILSLDVLECSSADGAAHAPAAAIDLTQEAMVIFTSGTTGTPKGARLTYGNLWFSAVASSRFLDQHRNDVWLATLSLHHIGGLSILFRGLIDGTHVVLHPRFNPEAALAAIDGGVTHVSLVPAMLRDMIAARSGSPWPESLRCVLLGGAASPQALLDASFARRIPVAPTYGLTESSSQATTLLPDVAPSKPGSSGLPLPTTQLRIVDQGRALPVGETGEIELRGPTLFAGYLGDERQSPRPDGWFATGDAGFLDSEGYLYVVDRRDDLIVSGGENIYPAEIERVLLAHPNVADAGVVGVPDAAWGWRPVAAVVWRGDPAPMESGLRAHCRAQLAGYKIPDRILAVDDLPRSPGGKLLRRRLRAAFTRESRDAEDAT